MRKTQSACLNAVCIKTNINSPSTAPTNPLTNTPSTASHSIHSLAFRWRNIGMGIIRFRFQFIVWWLFRSASKRFEYLHESMNICTRVTSHIFMCCSPSSPEFATKNVFRLSFVSSNAITMAVDWGDSGVFELIVSLDWFDFNRERTKESQIGLSSNV